MNDPYDTCVCGHPDEAHDAGECWTYPDASGHPDPRCHCSGFEQVHPDFIAWIRDGAEGADA